MRRLFSEPARGGDRGAAMILAITLLITLTAISATVATIGVSNIRNSDRDRQAGAALGASDAGVSQAIEYIRANGVGAITCPESAPTTCTGNPAGWTSPTNPQLVPLTAGSSACTVANCAKVWIGAVFAFNPPSRRTGTYRIHSEGIYGGGPAARNVVVQLDVTPYHFPVGLFGGSLAGNGNTSVVNESVFTTGCVSPREDGHGNGTRFTGTDSYWGIPAAAHSTSHVSTGVNCQASGYIHTPSAPCPNNPAINFDQSGDGGGPLPPGSPCAVTAQNGDGTTRQINTTFFGAADLQAYGYQARGLTDIQYAALKARSKAQGLYNLSSGIGSQITANSITQPVVYFDNQSSVNLSVGDFPGFNRAPDGACTSKSVTIVVDGHGSLTFQGGNNTWIDAMMFVPEGSYNGNGGPNILGTLWAQGDVSLGGNQLYQLDHCFAANPPGPMLDLHVTSFREDDSKDVLP